MTIHQEKKGRAPLDASLNTVAAATAWASADRRVRRAHGRCAGGVSSGEPLAGWRRTSIRERKTALDWAHEIRRLLEEDYAAAEKVVLVCDNLNTHAIGSLYEAFPPETARGLVERLEIHYTPKHGSWLNIAENELSVLTRQFLDRRLPDQETLHSETTAWHTSRNAPEKGVDWRFTTHDARIHLRRLYPQHKN